MADEKSIKIAVIDDELDTLSVLERLLGRESEFEVRVYSNPENGLDEVKGGNFDLVLLDIVMSQMDGIEVLKEIRAVNGKTKIIMISAYATLDRVLKSHQYGADDFILKPFKSVAKIIDKIKAILDVQQK